MFQKAGNQKTQKKHNPRNLKIAVVQRSGRYAKVYAHADSVVQNRPQHARETWRGQSVFPVAHNPVREPSPSAPTSA